MPSLIWAIEHPKFPDDIPRPHALDAVRAPPGKNTKENIKKKNPIRTREAVILVSSHLLGITLMQRGALGQNTVDTTPRGTECKGQIQVNGACQIGMLQLPQPHSRRGRQSKLPHSLELAVERNKQSTVQLLARATMLVPWFGLVVVLQETTIFSPECR